MDWSRAGTRPRVGKFNVLQEGKPRGEDQNWLLRERTFGRFSHNITLPEAVDEGTSQAKGIGPAPLRAGPFF